MGIEEGKDLFGFMGAQVVGDHGRKADWRRFDPGSRRTRRWCGGACFAKHFSGLSVECGIFLDASFFGFGLLKKGRKLIVLWQAALTGCTSLSTSV
jgi:hypothetical protein